jgi:hypothetical protein
MLLWLCHILRAALASMGSKGDASDGRAVERRPSVFAKAKQVISLSITNYYKLHACGYCKQHRCWVQHSISNQRSTYML